MGQLIIENLNVRLIDQERHWVEVLQDLSLHVDPSETVALVGESGCGKSTLTYAIFRLLPVAFRVREGRIIWNDQNLLQLENRELRRIRWKEMAIIFQDPASCLNPLMRIGKQIEEPMRRHLQDSKAAARQKTIELLHMVGLSDAERCYRSFPFEISSGMRQRALIAMALSCRPRLIIADEPTTSIDPIHQREIINLLLELKAELGLSLLFISHDLELVSQFADRVAVMHRGTVVEEGRPANLWGNPKHEQTRRLVTASMRHSLKKHQHLHPDCQAAEPVLV